jgi:DNA-binding PucR family transcriptional regulator/putative methionine-R-sulfoxide reductase with GAF domain
MYDLYMSEADTLEVGERAGRTVDARYLYQIINTVSSSLDLDRVLRAIVDLVSEAIDCHACFVYFVEPDDGSLVLRAVSDPYGALTGRLRFERGEGLAGWVVEHDQSLFIADNALADPRIRVVPEAEEEKYQSFCAAPLRAKSGHVIGVIALHAEAPREFVRADSDFLVHAASLVAGAIENARLYEDTRRRLALVEGLADLARAVSAAAGEEALLPAVAKRAHRMLGADQCDVLVLEDSGRLRLGAAWPAHENESRSLHANELGLELAKSARRGGDAGRRLAAILWGDDAAGTPMVVPMVVADDLVGFLALLMPAHRAASEAREIASSVAGQTAVAIRRVQLIDRLTERNAIKDLFEDLSHGGGSPSDLAERARALGCDLDQPHVVLQAAPRGAAGEEPWEDVAEAFETAVVRAFPGSLFDHRDSALRGLVRLRTAGEQAAIDKLRELHAAASARHPVAVGVSNACQELAAFATGFEEAEHAVAAAALVSSDPGVVTLDDLGAYKYLLRVAQDGRVRDRRGEALQKLAEYDRRHQAQLLLTLEEYLRRRGNIAAAAQTLYVHPNTLRQRLRRIQELTGLDVADEDWLMIEIELKLLRLEQALGAG